MLAVLVVGCSSAAPTPQSDAPLLPYALSPASLGRDLSLSQTVTGEFGDQERSMRVELEVTPERLVAVGLSPLGLPLFTIEQEGEEIRTTQLGGEQSPIDPRHVLSDMQLTHWPENVVRQVLATRGLRLEVDRAEQSRRVYGADGLLLAEITFGGAHGAPHEIVIQHYTPRYKLRITTIDQGD
jgi:hypothetical protein